jgi:flavin reductase (DIM6/NTAB) family NADH-FMN oxidoreductase RutF
MIDMAKIKIDYKEVFSETIEPLGGGGLLLVSKGKDNEPNIMTIGWGTIGIIWGRPVFIALVRPSRYTYSRIEEREEFTVNVPSKQLAKAASFCGTVSGRDHDKFKEMNLTAIDVQEVQVPIIEECPINYVCKSLHKNDLIPELIDAEVKKLCYPKGDFHRVYFGEILATYINSD